MKKRYTDCRLFLYMNITHVKKKKKMKDREMFMMDVKTEQFKHILDVVAVVVVVV